MGIVLPSPGTVGLAALGLPLLRFSGLLPSPLKFGFVSACYPDTIRVPSIPGHCSTAPICLSFYYADFFLDCLSDYFGLGLDLLFFPTLDVSIVKYNMSVIGDGVVLIEVRVCILDGRLLGGVRATFRIW